jgi:hypothetical protein
VQVIGRSGAKLLRESARIVVRSRTLVMEIRARRVYKSDPPYNVSATLVMGIRARRVYKSDPPYNVSAD